MTTLIVVGDFSPQGRLSQLQEVSPAKIFGRLQERLAKADLAILNLEAPLCCPVTPIIKTGPALHGSPKVAAFIAKSGFDLACLANNHIMDYGCRGLSDTLAALDRHGVDWTGAGRDYPTASQPYIRKFKGRTIAILNFAENEWSTTDGKQAGACPVDPVRNHRAIRDCKQSVDHVVVVCHGGHERHFLPSPRIKDLFRFYVDAGADAVVNHHPHCISGYEVYKGAPIFYSIGNFLFDSTRDTDGPWTRGMAVELSINDDGVSFQLLHFDQCTTETIFELADSEEAARRNHHLRDLNGIIGDADALQEAFVQVATDRKREYLSYLEPNFCRLVTVAQRRGWLPSVIRHRHRVLLLNLIRCESHREILIELLKRDVGDSR